MNLPEIPCIRTMMRTNSGKGEKKKKKGFMDKMKEVFED